MCSPNGLFIAKVGFHPCLADYTTIWSTYTRFICFLYVHVLMRVLETRANVPFLILELSLRSPIILIFYAVERWLVWRFTYHVPRMIDSEKWRYQVNDSRRNAIYFNKIKNLMAQEDKSGQHSEKLNYWHGRFEGLQWVLSNIHNG